MHYCSLPRLRILLGRWWPSLSGFRHFRKCLLHPARPLRGLGHLSPYTLPGRLSRLQVWGSPTCHVRSPLPRRYYGHYRSHSDNLREGETPFLWEGSNRIWKFSKISIFHRADDWVFHMLVTHLRLLFYFHTWEGLKINHSESIQCMWHICQWLLCVKMYRIKYWLFDLMHS